MKKTRCIISVLLLSMVSWTAAELQLNGLFTDNMVLQRNQEVPVWGTADPGTEVSVEFSGQKQQVTAGPDGSWMVRLTSMKASSDPQNLVASSNSDDSAIQLSNILIGDVWLCAGQSNMAQTMNRYLIWNPVKEGFSNDQIRLFKIKQGGVGSPEPTKVLVIDPVFKNSWQQCTPEFADAFSATAGFFGMKLQRETGVPVGLLYANRGGTQANMWMPREVLESQADYARFLDPSNANWTPSKGNPDAVRAPSHLYNGTIHPLAPFAIKGVIWYQGESDSRWPDLYEQLMADLVKSWRAAWGVDFPFLYVQLAPFKSLEWDQSGEAWAWLRDAQLQSLKSIPNSGMVVITDAGEKEDIHPQAKNIPGERLALLAASLDNSALETAFPVAGKMNVKEGKVRIKFSGTAGGLETRRVALNITKGHLPGEGPSAVRAEAGALKGFTVCGSDRVFVEAQARILSGDVVEVSSPDVSEPEAVRYGWVNFPLCNLYGGNGMPASPFRTDDFPMPNLTGETTGRPFAGRSSDWGAAMDRVQVADGAFRQLDVDGISASRAEGAYLYFSAPQLDRATPAQLHLVYHDQGYGTIQLCYDSTSENLFAGTVPGVWKPAGEVRCTDSKEWKVAAFDLPDAAFTKRCNGGDIRLQSSGALVVGDLYCGPLE